MEAHSQSQQSLDAAVSPRGRLPVWALAAIPLVLIVAALAALLTIGGGTLGERLGPPVEEVAVERTVLRPGEIELTVRNTGPDAVTVAQMFVNDTYVDFTTSGNEVGRSATETFTLNYPWQPDSPYLVTLVSATGATTEHEIPLAVLTPTPSAVSGRPTCRPAARWCSTPTASSSAVTRASTPASRGSPRRCRAWATPTPRPPPTRS